MRVFLAGLAATALVVAVGGVAVGRDEKVDGKLLVGKWTPAEEGKRDKLFLEFTKDGKLSMTADAGGKDFKIDGTYKLDGNKLAVTLDVFGKEQKQVMTVNTLTKTELVTTDEKGKKVSMVRPGDKK
ncbi:MAG TPA: TIGR03066 family protein [Urbifossiella sp.]|nr:TIGR03066 family protein [Urbifossiella sp.]